MKAQLAKLSKGIENTVEYIAETLERLRSSLILLQYRLLVNHMRTDILERQVNYYRLILYSLDYKNNVEAQRFDSYLDNPEEMQARLVSQRETLMQQYSENMAQYLETGSAISPKDLRAVRHCRAALRPDITAEQEYPLVNADNFDFS